MKIAIQEAETSLREGNHGFGAVIVKNSEILARTHDTDETEADPTAHAELKAIRKASSILGKDLSDCILVSTHEPCPMCAGAIVWSRMKRIACGYGIFDAIGQGRDRIGITCDEIFSKSKANIEIQKGILKEECSVLYNRWVREEIKKLRNASDQTLERYNEESTFKRLEWYRKERPDASLEVDDPIEKGYRLLLMRLGIQETDAPIVKKERRRIVFHSRNFCPTLEACKILQLDTRRVCKLYNEGSTNELIRQIDSKLCFTRNYEKLRPYTEYCEEMIEFELLDDGPSATRIVYR